MRRGISHAAKVESVRDVERTVHAGAAMQQTRSGMLEKMTRCLLVGIFLAQGCEAVGKISAYNKYRTQSVARVRLRLGFCKDSVGTLERNFQRSYL